jgi:hypothetical protein
LKGKIQLFPLQAAAYIVRRSRRCAAPVRVVLVDAEPNLDLMSVRPTRSIEAVVSAWPSSTPPQI